MKTNFSVQAQRFARELFDIGAVQFGEFRLKLHDTNPSAPLSPIFMNLRDVNNPKPGPLTPLHYKDAAKLMIKSVTQNNVRYNAICGLPNAGEPFTDAMVDFAKMRKQFLIRVKLKKETYPDGSRKLTGLAEGQGLPEIGYTSDLHILMVDDLITGADTKLEGTAALRDVGSTVTDLVVLIDRCQGGADTLLRQTGVITHSVFKLTELLEFYLLNNLIDSETYHRVLRYLFENS